MRSRTRKARVWLGAPDPLATVGKGDSAMSARANVIEGRGISRGSYASRALGGMPDRSDFDGTTRSVSMLKLALFACPADPGAGIHSARAAMTKAS